MASGLTKRQGGVALVAWVALVTVVGVTMVGGAETKQGRVEHAVPISKEGTFFLTIQATLPDQLGLKPLGYEVYLNGERVEEQEGHRWSRNYVPFFTVDRERGDGTLFPMHFVLPLSLSEDDRLTIRYPADQEVEEAKLHPAMNGVEASVGFDHAHHVYFTNDAPEAKVDLKCPSSKSVDGRLIVQHVRLADNQGQSSWNPGYRTTEVERLRLVNLRDRSAPEENLSMTVPLPKDGHRLVGLTVVLEDGDKRWAKYLGAASIVPPREMGRYHNEGRFISSIRTRPDSDGHEANAYKRFGIDWVRFGWHWNQWEPQPGEVDWSRSDQVFDIFRENKLRVMHLVGPVPKWARATEGDLKDVPYKGRTIKYDWAPAKSMLPRFGEAHRALYERYDDVIRACNIWNEPWEGMGITGWKSTGDHYRDIVREINDAVNEVDPAIKTVAADSAHNTQWKLFAAGMEDSIDVISTHYANPTSTHAYSLARYYDKKTWETETWRAWAGDASSVRHALLYFANGGDKVSLFNHQMFFDHRGNPTPGTVWVAAMREMLEGLSFEKVVHPKRPPFVFLFTGENRAVAAVTTSAFAGTGNPRSAFRSQFGKRVLKMGFRAPAETQVYDILGNSIDSTKEPAELRLKVSEEPRYIEYRGSPSKLASRLKQAHYENLRPVEITLRDITRRLGQEDAAIPVTLKNAYSEPINGQVRVEAQAIDLTQSEQTFELGAAEEKTLRFKVEGRTGKGNAFPVEVTVDSDRGQAQLSETLHVAVVAPGNPEIDGRIADWERFGAVPVRFGAGQRADRSQEAAWRPWKDVSVDGSLATEAAFAADENYLYFMARVKDSEHDPLPSMLAGQNLHEIQNPPADHMYVEAGPIPGEGGDYIQLALANGGRDPYAPRYEVREPEHPLHRLGAVQRSSYIYMIYPTKDGEAEIMRMRTPNFYYLHPLPIDYERLANRCRVAGAQVKVRRVPSGYVYEVGIPWSELPTIQHAQGDKARLNLKVRGNGTIYWSAGRSAARASATDFEPTWGNDWTTDTVWGFVGNPAQGGKGNGEK